MRRTTRLTVLVATLAALSVLFSGLALADIVQVNETTLRNDDASKAPGDTGTVTVWVDHNSDAATTGDPDGSGCNADADNPLLVTLASSDTARVLLPTDSTVSISDCGTPGARSLTFSVPSTATNGTATISASVTGGKPNGNKTYVTTATDTMTVTVSGASSKQNQTITFNQPTTPQAYGNTFNVNPTADSGLAVSLAATGPCTVAAATTGYDVTMNSSTGNCVLTASQAGNATYNAATSVQRTVAATTRAASVTPTAASKTYGDADPTLTGTLSGFLAADNVSATYSRAAGETVAGGPYMISATLSGTLTHYSITYNTANFTISQRNASVTPNAASKTYGTNDPSPLTTGTLTGFLTADNVTATYGRVAGENVADGPYTISATLSPAGVLANYNITYNTALFTINKANQTVTFTSTAPSNARVGDEYTPTATGGGSGNAVTFGASGACSISAGKVVMTGIGACTVTADQAGDANHNAATQQSQQFNVFYNFTGFFQPVENLPFRNTVKAGRAIPVKFKLGGYQGMDIFNTVPGTTTQGPISTNITCTSASSDEIETTLAVTNSTLSYDSVSDTYTYTWKTDSAWAGKCRTFKLNLKDGSTHSFQVALFK